jgi:tetratricopeptide (TPR) repeat protein
MKTKSLKILLIFILILGIVGCESRLDIPKKGDMGSTESFYKTDQDALAAKSALYQSFLGTAGSVRTLLNLLSDDIWCGGAQKSDNAGMEEVGGYMFNSSSTTSLSSYQSLYTVIYRACLILEHFEAFDTDIKKEVQAEAYFARGWANFYLAAMYGTSPLVDHLLSPSEYYPGNSTAMEKYEQAVEDFKAAIALNSLQTKTNLNDLNTVYITQEYAYAMLGKTYVFMKEWDLAIAAFDNVIGSGKYDLWYGDYQNIAKMESDFNCEYIMERNYLFDANNRSGNWGGIMYGWRTNKFLWANNASNPDADPVGYDLIPSGWGFYVPRKALYDAFLAMDPDSNSYRLRSTIVTYDQVYAMGVTNSQRVHGCEGFLTWKYRYRWSETNNNNIFSGAANDKVMRYAEVLLLAAEANVMSPSGSQADALDYINQIRDRAQLTDLGAVTLDDIQKEKRLELWGEGTRFLDLVRWGIAEDYLGVPDGSMEMPGFTAIHNGTDPDIYEWQVSTEYVNITNGYVEGQHNVLPIPDKEIMQNKNLEQNPGW